MKAIKTIFSEMRTFTIIWIGQFVSTIGSGLSGFALGVWLYEETGSPTLFAISLFVYFLPRVIFSPFAGVIADRWDRRKVMLISDGVAALATVWVAVMYSSGELAIWHIYVVHVAYSVANSLQWPAYSAAISSLVPKKHLARAGGMNQIGQGISSLIAPGVAGALYVTVGLGPILIVDIVTFFAAFATLIAVRFPPPVVSNQGEREKGSFWQDVLLGWRYIISRKGFLALQIIFAIVNFSFSIVYPLFTPMVLELTSPDMLGYINSITGVGLLLGTLTLSIWGGPKRRILGTYIFETMIGLSLVLTGLAPSIPLIVAAQFLGMFAMPITDGCTQAIWQTKVPQDIQGRVFSARPMISFSIIPLAYLISGPLSERVFIPNFEVGGAWIDGLGALFGAGPAAGMQAMYALFGLLYIIFAQGIILYPHLRQIEIELPDAVDPDEELLEVGAAS